MKLEVHIFVWGDACLWKNVQVDGELIKTLANADKPNAQEMYCVYEC